jgi:hypothetical protein
MVDGGWRDWSVHERPLPRHEQLFRRPRRKEQVRSGRKRTSRAYRAHQAVLDGTQLSVETTID